MLRKPWETPMDYTEDRFDDQSSGPGYSDEQDDDPFDHDDDPDPFDVDEDDELEPLDDEPLDYGQGPHDDEFGVDEEED